MVAEVAVGEAVHQAICRAVELCVVPGWGTQFWVVVQSCVKAATAGWRVVKVVLEGVVQSTWNF